MTQKGTGAKARRLDHYLRTSTVWSSTGDALEPWQSRIGDDSWIVRVNDFPEKHLYTLFVNGEEVEGFDDWPPQWVRMNPSQAPQESVALVKPMTRQSTAHQRIGQDYLLTTKLIQANAMTVRFQWYNRVGKLLKRLPDPVRGATELPPGIAALCQQVLVTQQILAERRMDLLARLESSNFSIDPGSLSVVQITYQTPDPPLSWPLVYDMSADENVLLTNLRRLIQGIIWPLGFVLESKDSNGQLRWASSNLCQFRKELSQKNDATVFRTRKPFLFDEYSLEGRQRLTLRFPLKYPGDDNPGVGVISFYPTDVTQLVSSHKRKGTFSDSTPTRKPSVWVMLPAPQLPFQVDGPEFHQMQTDFARLMLDPRLVSSQEPE